MWKKKCFDKKRKNYMVLCISIYSDLLGVKQFMAAEPNNKYAQKYDKAFVADLIEKFLKWAYEDDGIYIDSFTWENYKKPGRWIHDLAKSNPEIIPALEQAKTLLCAKIAKHCYLGDRNVSFGEKMLSMHSKAYRKHQEWVAQLAKQNSEQPQNITLVLQHPPENLEK